MRAPPIRSLLVSALLVVEGGCGATELDVLGRGCPGGGQTAAPAVELSEALGVVAYLHYLDTPYVDATHLVDLLARLRVRHVRIPGAISAHTFASLEALGAAGVKATVVADPTVELEPLPAACTDSGCLDVVTYAGRAPSAEAFQIHDANQIRSDATWPETVRRWARQVYTALNAEPATASVEVIGPSFHDPAHEQALGDVSAWLDQGSGWFPSDPPGAGLAARMEGYRRVSANKPLVLLTEYGTDGEAGDGSERLQAKYIPRAWLESFRMGARRLFVHELLEPNRAWRHGLVRLDGTPKPAFEALARLQGWLGPPRPPADTASLPYVIGAGAPADLRSLLLQDADRRFLLALWREIPSAPDDDAALAVRLTFPGRPARLELLDPALGEEAQLSVQGREELDVAVPDHVVMIRVTPSCSSSVTR